MSDARTRTRLLIEGYMAETGLDATSLARLARLAPSTLTRFLNSADFSSIPTTRTLEKLDQAITVWRATRNRAETNTKRPGVEQVGRFVQDPEQLAWLRIWDEMSPVDRRRAALVLRALAMDGSKFG